MSAPRRDAPVLVVEDDEDLRALIVGLLIQEGHEVRSASNGRDALELLRGGLRPSVILLDLMMPVMDGWQFRAEQRNDPALAAIPVVVLTAQGEMRRLVEDLGVRAGVQKPLHRASLLAVVDRYARRAPA